MQHSSAAADCDPDAAPAWFADGVKKALKDSLKEALKDSLEEALKDSLKELKDGLRDVELEIRDMKDEIKGIKKNVDTMQDDVCLLKEHSVKTQILVSKSYNLQCGDGSKRPFEPVPFLDGKEPSAQGLPALTNLDVIRKLSTRHASAYYKGYHQHQGGFPFAAERIEAIRVFVGCSVD
ncbi:hypothetical protein DFH08DRAFT_383472 [Mycena albidolilacea]|uniref:Mug135-like C-terminal domain-containing protein n=1 Tax=Mycena albidolilacea TaxID=1033008 RepID=A0AAD6ZG90_9AGAR|nr:hypothetical protein DFH08DRAFT_383472 [Mycena albidolilacea]